MSVGLAVDRRRTTYVEVERLGVGLGPRQDLATLVGGEGGERQGVEAGSLVSETSVHRVGRELERLLRDVILKERAGVSESGGKRRKRYEPAEACPG